MRIILTAAEVEPFIETCDMAHNIRLLARELKEKGVDVRVILPKYKDIPKIYTSKMTIGKHFTVEFGDKRQPCTIEQLDLENVRYYFIHNCNYFNRPGLYGYWDDGERFAFFTHAVLESLTQMNFKPDVIHCHDWHTAMIPVLLKLKYANHYLYNSIQSILAIHNINNQGIFPKDILSLFDIGEEHFIPEELEFYGNVNCLKGGLLFSDFITTTSSSHVYDMQQPDLGQKLEGVIKLRKDRFHGFIHGPDYKEFDPAKDYHIFKIYDHNTIKNKALNKRKLQKYLGLKVSSETPIIAMVTRKLVHNKGINLVLEAFEEMLSLDLQFILMGYGEKEYEKYFLDAAKRNPDRVSVNLFYDKLLSHRIYAGADYLLVPSLSEPCGIEHLIAQRYGTLPIVRKTGALSDMVELYYKKTGNKYLLAFDNYNAKEMLLAVKRALKIFNDKELFNLLRKTAMTCSTSCKESADEYIKIYKGLLQKTLAS